MTNDKEVFLKIAHNVRENKWENMIYRVPNVVDFVKGFTDMRIFITEDDICVLTQKIGKTRIINTIRANIQHFVNNC